MEQRQAQALVLRNSDCASLAAGRVSRRPRNREPKLKSATKQTPVDCSAGVSSFAGLLFFREILLLAIGGDAPHQIERQGLIQRELHRALAEFKIAEFRGKGRNSVRTGVKADVVLIRGKVHHVALEEKRRDAVGDFLRGVRGDFENRVAHLVEFCLHLRWELEDVVGDGGGHGFLPPDIYRLS
jgi:hypothetical protein